MTAPKKDLWYELPILVTELVEVKEVTDHEKLMQAYEKLEKRLEDMIGKYSCRTFRKAK